MFSDIFMCSCIEKKKMVKKDEDDLSSDEEYRDTYVKHNNNVSFDEEYNETFYYESHV